MKDACTEGAGNPMKPNRTAAGFSMTELVLVVAVLSILVSFAMPSVMQAYRGYELDGAATRVAEVLRLTKFEAIRRNNTINCLIQTTAASSSIWTDSNGDGIEQASEHQARLSGGINLAAGAPPNSGGLAASVGVGVLTVLTGPVAAVTFDARGAVNPPAVYVLYIQYPAIQGAGSRAVVLLPSGSVQVWKASANGGWVLYS